MPLATNTDIQGWLASDKIIVTDSLASQPLVEARRILMGMLSGVFTPLTLKSWDSSDPETDTPELIRQVVGELAAAYIYRNRYSEEGETVPEYAQTLYNEAIGKINEIKTGNLVVLDANDVAVSADAGTVLSFFPNDTTTPKFTMDREFA